MFEADWICRVSIFYLKKDKSFNLENFSLVGFLSGGPHHVWKLEWGSGEDLAEKSEREGTACVHALTSWVENKMALSV